MAPKRGEKRESKAEDKPPAKAQKTETDSKTKEKKQENGGKGSTNGNTGLKHKVETLLSDKVAQLAFPDVPQGHGEIDWPAGERRKRPPQEGAGKRIAKGGKSDKTAKKEEGDGEEENEKQEDMKAESSSGKMRTYHSPDLSPFEQLLCAVLLSKPISHQLGLRAIKTLLSPPYSFTTPKALEEAGNEGRREALWEARTQHKEKTAEQLGDLVSGVRKITGDEKDEESAIKLKVLAEHAKAAKGHDGAIEKVREELTQNIKGVGPTGADIFLRQVQRQPGWDSVFPFADQRAMGLAAKFGLVKEGGKHQESVEELASLVGKDPTKFVTLLDVLIGLDLEKKTDEAEKLLV